MKEYVEGDIVRWYSMSEDAYRHWCKSQIAIFEGGRFVDTFWHGSADSCTFKPEDIGVKVEITEEVGNFSDLVKIEKYYSNRYDSKDWVNLNHANNSSGNTFIRKGAKVSIDKLTLAYQRHIEHYKSKVEWYTSQRDRLQGYLDEGLTEESYMPCDSDVHV